MNKAQKLKTGMVPAHAQGKQAANTLRWAETLLSRSNDESNFSAEGGVHGCEGAGAIGIVKKHGVDQGRLKYGRKDPADLVTV